MRNLPPNRVLLGELVKEERSSQSSMETATVLAFCEYSE